MSETQLVVFVAAGLLILGVLMLMTWWSTWIDGEMRTTTPDSSGRKKFWLFVHMFMYCVVTTVFIAAMVVGAMIFPSL